MTQPSIALITGAAKRIGAQITKQLHAQGYNVIIHYRHSKKEAEQLAEQLNQQRAHSALTIIADLTNDAEVKQLAEQALAWQGQINLLVNNASSFYSKAFTDISLNDWDELVNSNVKSSYFLTHYLLPSLKIQHGNVINIIDANLDRLLNQFSTYQMAKAAAAAMTKTLAKELAPDVRVNGISPGAILWANHETSHDQQEKLASIPMQRLGSPQDIADAVLFLASANYITGHILTIDGGRSL